MKITVQLLLFSLLLGTALGLALLYSERAAVDEIRMLGSIQEHDLEKRYDALLRQQALPLERFTKDFASSQQVTAFLKKYDYESLRYDLTSAMATYRTDGVWFFVGDKWAVVHAQSHPEGFLPAESPVPVALLIEQARRSESSPFFVRLNGQLLQVKWSALPSVINENSAQPVHLLVAQLWDANHLRELSELSAARVSLRAQDDPSRTVPTGVIPRPIFGGQNDVVGYLDFAPDRRVFEVMESVIGRQYWLSVISLIVLAIGMIFFTRVRLVSALQLITSSLRHSGPHVLTKLSEEHSEIGELARASIGSHRSVRKLEALLEDERRKSSRVEVFEEEPPWAPEAVGAKSEDS